MTSHTLANLLLSKEDVEIGVLLAPLPDPYGEVSTHIDDQTFSPITGIFHTKTTIILEFEYDSQIA